MAGSIGFKEVSFSEFKVFIYDIASSTTNPSYTLNLDASVAYRASSDFTIIPNVKVGIRFLKSLLGIVMPYLLLSLSNDNFVISGTPKVLNEIIDAPLELLSPTQLVVPGVSLIALFLQGEDGVKGASLPFLSVISRIDSLYFLGAHYDEYKAYNNFNSGEGPAVAYKRCEISCSTNGLLGGPPLKTLL